MYCNRETTIVAKSQIGFLKSIALPLYESLNFFLSSEIVEKNCIEQIKDNINTWEFELKSGVTMRETKKLKMSNDLSLSPLMNYMKSNSDIRMN